MEVVILPHQTISWESFKKNSPENSIALDGYVSGASILDKMGHRQNFNHHEGVDRFSTMSTAMQVANAIRLGIFSTFNFSKTRVYINDVDQDVCLAIWALSNHTQIKETTNWRVNRLLNIGQVLDVFSGVFPGNLPTEFLEELKWVFEPFTAQHPQDISSMKSVLDDIINRIDKHISEKGEKINLDTQYSEEYHNKNWCLVKETGSDARLRFLQDGIMTFISYRTIGEKYQYTLGNTSPYSTFPELNGVYQYLNRIEGISETNSDKWGGSNMIGGSPRERKSKISPSEMIIHINTFLRNI